MKRLTLLLVAWLLLSALPCEAQSQPEALSPYWGWGIRRWEALILAHAARGNLDPDFLAALVWSESAGNADEVSYAGAVGLMQVMPYELGFTTRPTAEELRDPNVNMIEGMRVLRLAFEMAHGAPFAALCLYNGGSEFADSREARGYAEGVIRLYIMAVAAREGHNWRTVDGWRLIFQVQGYGSPQAAANQGDGWLTTWRRLPPSARMGWPIAAIVYEDEDEYSIPWRTVAWMLPEGEGDGREATIPTTTPGMVGRVSKVWRDGVARRLE